MLEKLRDNLKLYFPFIVNGATEYFVRGMFELIVKMKDGRVMSYNDYDKTFRILPRDANNLTDEEFKREFGIRLSYIMRQKHITQSELSQMTGISQPRLSELVNGNRIPNLYTADKIAKALGCSVDDFRYYI